MISVVGPAVPIIWCNPSIIKLLKVHLFPDTNTYTNGLADEFILVEQAIAARLAMSSQSRTRYQVCELRGRQRIAQRMRS